MINAQTDQKEKENLTFSNGKTLQHIFCENWDET